MRVLFVGGGSIGHVAPAVAVWRALEKKETDMRFICSEEPVDAAFLLKEGIPYTALRGRRFSPLRPDVLIRTFLSAKRLIAEFRPDAVFSKGGALSVPVCFAAKLAGVPIVLHESDAVNGRANKMVAKWATTVCLGFPQKAVSNERRAVSGGNRSQLIAQSSSLFTGNPVRPGIAGGDRKKGMAITGLSGGRPVLLVMGGSQGAQALNEAVVRLLPELLASVDVIHLTGKGKPGAAPRAGYWSTEFAYGDLPHLYALSALSLSRSGAGGISELAANGIPALLVPLRGLAQDHQLHNAEAAAASGGCTVLEQQTLDHTLVPAVRDLAADAAKRGAMGDRMRALHVPDAAERIAASVMAAAGGER